MREPDYVGERIETPRPCNVQRSRFLRPVEVSIASLADLNNEHVQVRSVRIGDQLLDLTPRLDPVVEGINPHRPILRLAEHDRNFGWRWRSDWRWGGRLDRRSRGRRRDRGLRTWGATA